LLAFWHQNEFYSEEQQTKVAYSRQLKDIVMKMVEVDPSRRMESTEVYSLLEGHRDDIMTLKPFELNFSRTNSPKKRSVPK
jgi:serine/threonine protein kinase